MKHWALLSLSAALLVVAGAASALAGGGTQVSFSPASASATVGSTVAVDINVANVSPEPGLAAYDLVLSFDATVVRLDSLTASRRAFVERQAVLHSRVVRNDRKPYCARSRRP
ncbi:MAG: hypothetical protein IH988_09060 [Planctomycetes bacterium]|nr:hypothetical protein [Planctomycetota bacterium]